MPAVSCCSESGRACPRPTLLEASFEQFIKKIHRSLYTNNVAILQRRELWLVKGGGVRVVSLGSVGREDPCHRREAPSTQGGAAVPGGLNLGAAANGHRAQPIRKRLSHGVQQVAGHPCFAMIMEGS